MARMPYTNFHDINLDWIIKRVMKAFTPDNPPDYPVKSVNNKTGHVVLDSDDIQDLDSGLDLTDALRKKQNRPESVGTAGQVLGLDNQLQPVWLNQPAPGVSDYDDLTGLPKINNVTLSGELDGIDLGLLDAPDAAGSQGQVLTSDGNGGQSWENLPDYSDVYAPIIRDTTAGDPASFPDGIADMEMIVQAFINPVQDLHGYANPWPAGGGKNKADYPGMISAGAIEQEDGSLYVATAQTFNNVIAFQNDGTEGQFAITFIIKNDGTSRGIYPVIYYTDSTSESFPVNFGYTSYTTFTKVTQSGKTVDKVTFTYGTGAVKNWFYIQVESGSTTTPWEPYANICPISGNAGLTLYTSGADTSNPDEYLVAWGDVAGTVYGGTFNSKTGKLIANRAYVVLNDKTKWIATSGNVSFYYNVSFTDRKIYADSFEGLITTMFPVASNLGVPYMRWESANGTRVGIKDSSNIYSLQDIQDMSESGNLAICYTLATPIEYDLYSINNLKTVYGDNNVWTDVGPVSVDYYADTKLFILKVVQ